MGDASLEGLHAWVAARSGPGRQLRAEMLADQSRVRIEVRSGQIRAARNAYIDVAMQMRNGWRRCFAYEIRHARRAIREHRRTLSS